MKIPEKLQLHKELEQLNWQVLHCKGEEQKSPVSRSAYEKNILYGLNEALIKQALSQQEISIQLHVWQEIRTYKDRQEQIKSVLDQLPLQYNCSQSSKEEILIQLQEIKALYQAHQHQHREIQEILREYDQVEYSLYNSPYLAPTLELERIVIETEGLLNTLLQENSQSVEHHLSLLRRAVLKAEERKEGHLQALVAQPNSHRDPGIRYTAVLNQAHSLISQAEIFLEKPDVPALYAAYGAAYYYYNHLLGNKFSRKGDALVDQYHRFLALSDVPLRRQLVMSNWLQVLELPRDRSAEIEEEFQTIVFLIDVSGSMRQPNKMDLFKRTFLECLNQLNPADQVSLVTYSGASRVCLPATSITEKDHILSALHQVEVGGKSSPEIGMQLAYEEGLKAESKQRSTRIVLITDGGFFIEKPLLEVLEKGKETEVSLNVLYLGQDEGSMRERLSRLADVAGGHYAYLQRSHATEILMQELRKGWK